jgi:cytochrome bd-type quinol oxidase subunit 2
MSTTPTLNGTTTPIRIHHPSTLDIPTTNIEPSSTSDTPQSTEAIEPRKPHKPWPLLIIGLAAAVAVWSGWVGLGQLAGFGVIHPLPGIWDDLRVNTAVVLPLSVEAYAAYALRVWLATESSNQRTVRFAKWSAIASMIIGAIAQVAYHLMSAAGYHHAPWPVVTLVATVPVVVLGLASALAKLVTTDQDK